VHVDVERAVPARAKDFSLRERGAGCRRAPRERSSRPSAADMADVTSTSSLR
jgi:hypothetical protein